MKSIYLAGAITGTSRSFHGAWRHNAGIELQTKYRVLNPLHQAQYDGSNREEIIKNDLRMITECDALLVNGDRPSWGTAMEVFFAYQLHKPIYIACSIKDDMAISPWLLHCCSIWFNTMEQAINYLLLSEVGEV